MRRQGARLPQAAQSALRCADVIDLTGPRLLGSADLGL